MEDPIPVWNLGNISMCVMAFLDAAQNTPQKEDGIVSSGVRSMPGKPYSPF